MRPAYESLRRRRRRRGVSAAQPPTRGWSPGTCWARSYSPIKPGREPHLRRTPRFVTPWLYGRTKSSRERQHRHAASALARRMWHGFDPVSSMSRSAPTPRRPVGKPACFDTLGKRLQRRRSGSFWRQEAEDLCPHRRSPRHRLPDGVRRNLGSRAPRGARRELARADLAPAHRWHDLSPTPVSTKCVIGGKTPPLGTHVPAWPQ
jgi:hypothetical protein